MTACEHACACAASDWHARAALAGVPAARVLVPQAHLPAACPRYLVVTNPHIKRVYNAYYHAFEVWRTHGNPSVGPTAGVVNCKQQDPRLGSCQYCPLQCQNRAAVHADPQPCACPFPAALGRCCATTRRCGTCRTTRSSVNCFGGSWMSTVTCAAPHLGPAEPSSG